MDNIANPFITRAQSVVNWFRREPRREDGFYQQGASSLYDSVNRHNSMSQQSVISAIWNRIAVDVANVSIKHIRTDDSGDYIEDMKSHFNDVLNVSANYDQTPQAFMVDAVISLFEEGSIAIIPETTANPYQTDVWDIISLRVAKIVDYKPKVIDVEIYDEVTGKTEQWTVPKAYVAIIENPLFYIMNKTNATLKRLTRAIALLDQANDDAVSGKIDLIIHVPYTIRSESRQKIAEGRRKDIEDQLKNSKYGIAYMDPTETVTQLNRPTTNNLLEQVEALTIQALTQLGVTEGILNGTADEKTMTNYRSRIIGMILRAFVQEYKRKFLSPTARGNGQSVAYLFDVFEFSTAKEFAEIAEIFKRSEVATTDEMRSKINLRPSNSPQGDKIQNPNINTVEEAPEAEVEEEAVDVEEEV